MLPDFLGWTLATVFGIPIPISKSACSNRVLQVKSPFHVIKGRGRGDYPPIQIQDFSSHY